MNSNLFALKPDVIAEPLINHWYAWINLISPVTFSFYLLHQTELLNSYLMAPHLHEQAVNNRRLIGGAFLDSNSSAVLEHVKDLCDYTKNNLSDNIDFVTAIKSANKFLIEHGNGGLGFFNIYNKLPDLIRGYVELVYDINHAPSLRFIEPLLYKSSFYKSQLQSVLFYQANPDTRAFVLSTPRFAQDNSLRINIPFSSDFYDKLFHSRINPIDETALRNLHDQYLSELDINLDLFKSIFETTNNVGNPRNRVKTKGTKITYYGHACVLIESELCNIMIDPLVAYKNIKSTVSRLTYDDLPETINYVLLTHSHQDHTVLETLLQIRYKIKNIIVPSNNKGSLQDPSLKLFLLHCGFKNVYEISELEEMDIEGGKITALPFFGEHADLDIRSKLAYAVNIEKKSLLFMADSKNLEPKLYEYLSKATALIDVIFIGLECKGAPLSWLYGPMMFGPLSRTSNLSRRLNGSNSDEALSIIELFHCKKVFVYAMGHEPWMKFISNLEFDEDTEQYVEAKKLVSFCEKSGIQCEILYGSQKLDV